MVQIGKKIKYNSNGRITLPIEIANMLNLVKDQDEVFWEIRNGDVILRKVTKKYAGIYDFESSEIKERLISYEKKYEDNFELNTEELSIEELARIEYLKDKKIHDSMKNRDNHE